MVALQTRTSVQLGSIRLFFGELFARIDRLTQRGGGRVLTNELTASVQGTEYRVLRRVPGDPAGTGTTEVTVRQGRVLCDPAGGASWRSQSLTPDQMLVIDGMRERPELQLVDAKAQTTWADQAIRRLLEPRSNTPSFGIQFPIIGPSRGGDRGDRDGLNYPYAN